MNVTPTVGPFVVGSRCRADYTERGETHPRQFILQAVFYGATMDHPDAGWFLDIFDLDDGHYRTLPLAGFLGGADDAPSPTPEDRDD